MSSRHDEERLADIVDAITAARVKSFETVLDSIQ